MRSPKKNCFLERNIKTERKTHASNSPNSSFDNYMEELKHSRKRKVSEMDTVFHQGIMKTKKYRYHSASFKVDR
jgi:hypothetical protein